MMLQFNKTSHLLVSIRAIKIMEPTLKKDMQWD